MEHTTLWFVIRMLALHLMVRVVMFCFKHAHTITQPSILRHIRMHHFIIGWLSIIVRRIMYKWLIYPIMIITRSLWLIKILWMTRQNITLSTTKDLRVAAMSTIAMMELMIVIMNMKKSPRVDTLYKLILYFLSHYKWIHHLLTSIRRYLKLIKTLSKLYRCLISRVSSNNNTQPHHLSTVIMKLVWANKLLIYHPIKLVIATPSKMHVWETQWEIVTVLTIENS